MMVGTPWKETLVKVLVSELTGVVERFTIMSTNNKDLLATARPELLKARDDLTSILETI